MAQTLSYLQGAGFAQFTSVVPGPLLRATSGATLTHMPLVTGSTFVTIKDILERSMVIANQVSPDKDLDLQGQLAPSWANHSLRRLADTTARRYMNDETHGGERVKKWEIDLLLGWNEAEMKKDTQLHYATMGVMERVKQARITCMI